MGTNSPHEGEGRVKSQTETGLDRALTQIFMRAKFSIDFLEPFFLTTVGRDAFSSRAKRGLKIVRLRWRMEPEAINSTIVQSSFSAEGLYPQKRIKRS